MKQKVLVTGGTGYIGSHTVVELQMSGYDVVIVDNLSNSKEFIVDRIEQITGLRPRFYNVDMCDKEALNEVFVKERKLDVAIHFAAFKAVGESVKLPLMYFKNNLNSLINLIECLNEYQCMNLVFSSSATVYGEPDQLPIRESDAFKKPLSAYGSTKQIGEDIMEKVTATGSLNGIALRYFNPVGAHPSGLIGELPLGTPNNLMPFLTQAVIGNQKQLTVYGNNYNTSDGSCIRDYIHVVDLAKAHVQSCHRLIHKENELAFEAFNIGTGNGISVFELINAFEQENEISVPYTLGARRQGDAEAMYADVTMANRVLKWEAKLGIADMVKDAWRWEKALAAET